MIYIVYKYSYEEHVVIFATHDFEKARIYCEKGNRLLKKWQEYFTFIHTGRSDQVWSWQGFWFREIQVR